MVGRSILNELLARLIINVTIKYGMMMIMMKIRHIGDVALDCSFIKLSVKDFVVLASIWIDFEFVLFE